MGDRKRARVRGDEGQKERGKHEGERREGVRERKRERERERERGDVYTCAHVHTNTEQAFVLLLIMSYMRSEFWQQQQQQKNALSWNMILLQRRNCIINFCSTLKQTQVCTTYHDPEKLRKSHANHKQTVDIHAQRKSCSFLRRLPSFIENVRKNSIGQNNY